MRIAYVTDAFPPQAGSAAVDAARTVAYLRACGHDVQLIRPRQADEAAVDTHWEWRTSGWTMPLRSAPRLGWAGAGALRTRWAGARPDRLHVATAGPLGLSALCAARDDGIARSAEFGVDDLQAFCSRQCSWMQQARRIWLRRLHGSADLSFVPTAGAQRLLEQQGFKALEVAARGVDVDRFAPSRRDPGLRRAWSAGGDDPVLLYVGPLAPEHNARLALRTFELVRAHQPAAHMLVIGDGPERTALQSAYPHVRFIGKVRDGDLAQHYASADILLLPSRRERFDSTVLLEAMASGMAVVAFDIGAARDHLRDGHDGRLARDTASAAFGVAALRALQQATPGSPLRRRARETALGLAWSRVLSQFERRLCESAAPARHGRAGLSAQRAASGMSFAE